MNNIASNLMLNSKTDLTQINVEPYFAYIFIAFVTLATLFGVCVVIYKGYNFASSFLKKKKEIEDAFDVRIFEMIDKKTAEIYQKIGILNERIDDLDKLELPMKLQKIESQLLLIEQMQIHNNKFNEQQFEDIKNLINLLNR